MIPINQIDTTVLDEFCDRKYPGRLDFFVDVNTGEFYPVPRDIEHKDFAPKIDPGSKNLIPSQLRLDRGREGCNLIEILVGASSYEATTGVRHTNTDLVMALNYTWDLINRSPLISTKSLRKNKILRDFEQRV